MKKPFKGLGTALKRSFGNKVKLLFALDGLLVTIGALHYWFLIAVAGCKIEVWLYVKSIVLVVDLSGVSPWAVVVNAIVGYGLQWFTYSVMFLGFQDFFKELYQARLT